MPDDPTPTENSRSFGAAAAEYERGRPSYPTAAVDWLLEGSGRRVLELGAGTGKLTRQLLARGLDLVAVEPSEGMRGEFSRVLPDVRVLAGAAESLPLPDHTVDAVLVAHAWHWVDAARAVPEVARVLTPGGRLGLVWNTRDEREGWVAELGTIFHGYPEGDTTLNPTIGEPFGPIDRFEVAWVYRLTRRQLLDLVTSRSYVITLNPHDREAVIAAVVHLMDTHQALAGSDDIAMPYVTQCFRARLP